MVTIHGKSAFDTVIPVVVNCLVRFLIENISYVFVSSFLASSWITRCCVRIRFLDRG